MCEQPRTLGAGLLAKAVGHSASMLPVLTPSRAGSLPQGLAVYTGLWSTAITVWERACSRLRWVSRQPGADADAFASKLAPTLIEVNH